MKVFFIFVVCIFVAEALTDDKKEKLMRHRKDCIAETRVDEQLINKLNTGDFKNVNDKAIKYTHCMLVKSEMMTRDGQFKKEVALAKIPAQDKPAVEKVIDACLANKGNTPHQSAWNYVKCYNEKYPNDAFLL